jgi:catechol 2,3-dioxygenase-like lactoylglutathione lyase family enzyme
MNSGVSSLVAFFLGTLTAMAQAASPPTLERIRIATIGARDVAETERLYTEWLGQSVRERGAVSAEMAASWGAAQSAGRPYVLLSSDAHPDVFIRAVEVDAPAGGYTALTTWGWNAIEIIVDDIDALHAALKNSPFRFIGGPASLGVRYPTIHAMQVVGPSQEVLYLTTETGDRSQSSLPLPGAAVGRPFIMVVAGPDIAAARDWWAETFAMTREPINPSLAGLARRAQGLPEDAPFTISLVRMAQHGNMIQLDGYPPGVGARASAPGQLPPGAAMTSFEVKTLEALRLDYLSPPRGLTGAAYGNARAATVIGPSGELIELIEKK